MKLFSSFNVHIDAKKIIIGIMAFALMATMASAALAPLSTPPSGGYAPGDLLDPGCSPGDTDCVVTVSGITWSLTGNTGLDDTINFLGTTDATDLVFKTDGTEALRIDTSGNVGIGLANPTQALDVNGAIKFNGAFMPGGLTGSAASGGAYDFLVSNGVGVPPVWTNIDLNVVADNRISIQRGAVDGIASLDSTGRVPTSQIPATVLNDTFVVTNFADCPAAPTATLGDVCIVTSENTNYILDNSDSWIALLTPASPVTSVNGAIGSVTLTSNNGLTTSGTNTVLGGSLTADTSINLTTSYLSFTGAGYVGIGLSSGAPTPREKLDVEGNIRFNGALMPGGLAGSAPTGSTYTGISGTSLSGTEYSLLTSQGAGTPPTWESFDFSQLADARIGAAGGVIGGFAPLDSGLKIPTTYLPPIPLATSITVVVGTVSSIDGCVSLTTAVASDVCVAAGSSRTYMLRTGGSPTVSSDWIEILAPLGVSSINTLTGSVDLTASNGLTRNTTSNYQLGGSLIKNTTINQSGFYINFTGTSNFGLGNIVPSQRLDVSGNVAFSGALMPGPSGSGSAGTSGQVLTSAGSGTAPTWTTLSSDWSLTGNAATTAGTNFVGTTDAIDLVFKTNSAERLRVSSVNGRLSTTMGSLQSTMIDGGNDTFTGTKNTGIGVAALSGLTTGNQNTAVGRLALSSSTTGVNNIAMGLLALGNGTSGNGNVGLGNNALLATTGNNNVGIGLSAGSGVTSGSSNILIGASADNVTTGSSNIIIGASATAISATTSNQLNIGGWIIGSAGNIGIGTGVLVAPANKLEIKQGTAGLSGLRLTNMLSSSTATSLLNGKVLSVNTTGDVTLVDLNEKSTGFWSLAGNAGALSTDFIGFTDSTTLVFKTNNVQTGYINGDGLGIGFGPSAGSSASGTNTFFVGSSAGSGASSAANSTFIGASAGSAATGAFDSIFMGSQSGQNTTNANQSIFLGKQAGKNATSASSSNFIGILAGSGASSAANSTFIGASAGVSATNAANSIFIGSSAGASDTVNNTAGSSASILIGNSTGTGGFSDSIALGRSAVNSAANQLMIGSTTSPITSVRIQAGLGTQCTITVGFSMACTSDERLKKNIEDVQTGILEKLAGVRTVHYNLIDDATNRYQVGFLAQNLEQYFPELVDTGSDGYKSVYYSQMTPILVQAVRELDLKVSDFSTDNSSDTSLMAILKNWFASATNGIGEMIAGTIRARDQVCIDDVCMTKDQLRTILENNNMSSGSVVVDDSSSDISSDVSTDAPSDTPSGDSVVSDPILEPEITPEPLAEPVPEVSVPDSAPEPTPVENPL